MNTFGTAFYCFLFHEKKVTVAMHVVDYEYYCCIDCRARRLLDYFDYYCIN